MTQLEFVAGHGGTRLAVRVAGDPANPPVVFVHGWARCARDWAAQFADPALTERFRLLAVDLRGHGESGVSADGYDDPAVWAADLAAVLGLAGAPAVLVGSSYGGLVITDYLRVRGPAGVAGLVLAGAVTEIGAGHPGGAVGPLLAERMRDYLSEDPAVAVPALARLAEGLTAEPAPGPVVQRRLGEFLLVPPRVRRALFRRDLGSAEVLARVPVPTLVVHGTADRVVAPSAAEYAAGKIPGASLRWFQAVGHLPFAERAGEFGQALRELADSCGRTTT
ncbi:MAG TPA: alpha/beta hydrolase [Actinophytocola sp.]|uniref:alpha/beta fold hydrolase n=1 Tax=Actinophytocola sp. TaxID=1872138 RepID=UPI002DB68129|nr:alpha/beta hydrolase [Actinophytocola sp.]HEU5469793.1 alpha/beta hydrolase [Actinophytocola sp.]